MTGLEEGQTANLLVCLLRDGETVHQASLIVHSGNQTAPLEFGHALEVGYYELQARVADSKRTVSETFRVISSPWEETP
jgi:hypothetical protein